MDLGVILGDVAGTVPPREHLDALLRQVEAAQRAGLRYVTIGQHFVYGDLRWLQPIPTLARIAAELDDDVTLATTIVQVPLYHPVMLAEELATLDVMTRGRLVVGAGAGYRREEFDALGVRFEDRFAMLDEGLGLVRRLWTEDVVDHEGRFWSLRGARPHLRCWQQPHPLVWVGAMSETGVRRAARLGDGWPVTPETRVPRMLALMAIFEDERDRLGLAHVRHPLRREVVPARTTDDAYRRFETMAKERLLAYAQRRLTTRDAGELASSFREVARQEAFVGTPDECVAQIAGLAARAPIGPVLVRAQWPGMDGDAVVAYLEDLGRDIVPAVRAITSVDRVDRVVERN
jgi:alkanesulfonate monooxygenase SsuD/methylene tetrahydromethanopterin reductase-like flavin-dependent oxidoreductase (luciferase family)